MLTPEKRRELEAQYGVQGTATSAAPKQPGVTSVEELRNRRAAYQKANVPAESTFKEKHPVLGGIAEGTEKVLSTIGESAVGTLKGATSTFIESPLRSGATLLGTGMALDTAEQGTDVLSEGQDLNERNQDLLAHAKELDKGSDEYKQIIKEVHNNIVKMTKNSESLNKSINTAQKTLDFGQTEFEALKPKTGAEKFGYGVEKIGEFLLPTSAINKSIKFINKAVDAKILAKHSGPLANFAAQGLKILGRGITEGTAAAGVTAAQGDIEDIDRNTALAVGISMTLGILGSTAAALGSKFVKGSEKLYQSALKPSTAKGAASAKDVVQTGLREGIRLTEQGVQKTANVIDDLEIKLGQAIDKAAGEGRVVKSSTLKSFIDEAKEILGNTVDVKGSSRAVNEIDDLYVSFVEQHGDEIPIELAQKLKTNTYQVLKDAYGELANPVREGMKQLTRGLKEGIVEAAPVTANINARLKALYQFDEALSRASGRIKNLNLLGLGTKVLAAGGPKTQILAALNQILGSPISKSNIAIIMNRIGTLLKGQSDDAIKGIASNSIFRQFINRLKGVDPSDLAPEEQVIFNKIMGYTEKAKEVVKDRTGSVSFGGGMEKSGLSERLAKRIKDHSGNSDMESTKRLLEDIKKRVDKGEILDAQDIQVLKTYSINP